MVTRKKEDSVPMHRVSNRKACKRDVKSSQVLEFTGQLKFFGV